MNQIASHFSEATIASEDEKTILNYLEVTPTYVRDSAFIGILGRSRTILQEVLSGLERKGLVRRDTLKIGVKQKFYVTPKGGLILEHNFK